MTGDGSFVGPSPFYLQGCNVRLPWRPEHIVGECRGIIKRVSNRR